MTTSLTTHAHRPRPRLRQPAARIAGCALALLMVASPVAAQSAKTLYGRAQARETAARKQSAPSLTTLRSVATAYENLVRRYPTNSYADNALWQAALLLELAHQRGGQTRDLSNATRLLRWLTKEYPHSALTRQGASKLAGLDSTKAPAVAAVRPVAPPAPQSPVSAPAAVASATTVAHSALTTAGPAAAAITLTGLTLSPLPKGDRLIIALTRESAYVLDTDASGRQLRLALSDVGLNRDALDAVARLRGAFVQSARSTTRSGGADLVLSLNGQARHSAFPLYEPYRLVIDIESDAPAPRAAVSRAPPPVAAKVAALPPVTTTTVVPASRPIVPVGAPIGPSATAAPTRESIPTLAPPVPVEPAVPTPLAPASTSRGSYSLARQLGLGVSRIVIDPGHGGHDPGARANGINEADIVLDVALRLEALLLAQPGFEVVLTRRTNTFIALEERTAMANRESADLFLSIHANASPRTSTQGIETYFLNLATNPQAEAVAARENASSVQTMRLLPQLVRAITNNSKLAESRELAGMVQAALLRQMRTQTKDIKDLGVKQAPFVVLIGAAMPSVLAEIAFITNRADATQLKLPAGRQKIAQALADAMLRYQSSLKKATSVAAVEQIPTRKGQN